MAQTPTTAEKAQAQTISNAIEDERLRLCALDDLLDTLISRLLPVLKFSDTPHDVCDMEPPDINSPIYNAVKENVEYIEKLKCTVKDLLDNLQI